MTAVSEEAPSQRLLLVEDEAQLARTLKDMLHARGFAVDVCPDGRQALETARDRSYHLILLDVMLPSLDGFEVAARLRGSGVDTPILMLTARHELSDKVAGLKSGADDYLTKPFEADELLARIDALLRRAARASTSELRSFDFGGMRVDFRKHRLTQEDKTIDLSDQEWELLRYLIEHRGAVVSRDTLLREVWGYESVPVTRTVDVHVAWLRQKIEVDPKSPQFIVTVHGKGYRFEG